MSRQQGTRGTFNPTDPDPINEPHTFGSLPVQYTIRIVGVCISQRVGADGMSVPGVGTSRHTLC